jgi:hypothetical protein
MKRLLILLALLSLSLLIGGCQTFPQNGQGTYTTADGKYDGDFKDGKKHGQGTVTFADGGKYVGDFKDDKYNGQGTYTWANGEKYVGEWKNGKHHGQGTRTMANGYSYVGEFKYNYRHGRGIQTYADGRVQEGIFIDNNFVRAEKINPPPVDQQTDVAINDERRKLDADRQVQNKLPICPPVDYSKNTHLERVAKWHNCFGRYVSKLNDAFEGDVMEGEFRNGNLNGQGTYYYLANNGFKGQKYVGEFKDGKKRGQGTFTFPNGEKYVGEFKEDQSNGQGTYTHANGDKYVGEVKDWQFHGKGTYSFADGRVQEGIFENGNFVRAEKVNLPPIKQQTDVALNEERRKLDVDRQALELERQRLTEERNRREQAKQSSRLSLQTTTTNPDANGVVIITVRTNVDTSSLKVNGNEEGGKIDGNYIIKRIARVGQDTEYSIIATDVFGNTASTTITVARQTVSQSSNQSASLKPENIKRAPARDAVAIIIGIQNYKRVPKADFANNDAKEFYEYAIRGLGIKPENIKLLLDEEADELEIVKAFENWLPLQVNKNKTDVYVFYSGHGLPSPDGQSLYFLPYGVDKQYLSRTAVGQKEVVALLTASKPKSVTMFIDACYSGQTRGGETLLASAKPIALKTDTNVFPSNFTVISASANDQISSSSPELKHGIFSFYLMKGMEGDADGNKDGKITAGEMQEYLSDKVSRQAMSMSRKQDTQLVGDANKVLMGR